MATKKEILDYCTYTPHNTNRHVLSTMLDEFVTSDNKQEIELSATTNNIYFTYFIYIRLIIQTNS